MVSASSPGAVNVRMNGRDIGFVIPAGSGKWDGYAYFKFRAGHSKMGTYSSKSVAIHAVQYLVSVS
jgi:hypothetical protein